MEYVQMTTLHLPSQLRSTHLVSCGNPPFCPYPLLTLVPAIFSLRSLSYQSTPFQTLPLSPHFISLQTHWGLGHPCQWLLPSSSAGSLSWSLPHPLPTLQQGQHQQWPAVPPQTSKFSHPHRISLSASKLHREGKHTARMTALVSATAELSNPLNCASLLFL